MATPGPARLLRAAAASSRRWLFSSASPAAGPRPGSASAAAAGRTARPFSLSARAVLSSEDKITVHFINRDGDKLTAKGKPGDSLLDVVVDNNLDIDGFGACEGTLACSTCHLIFEDHIFEKLDAITDEEMDMLDLAYGLTETSRLGCQICLKKSMNDMTVRVPEAVADARQSVKPGQADAGSWHLQLTSGPNLKSVNVSSFVKGIEKKVREKGGHKLKKCSEDAAVFLFCCCDSNHDLEVALTQSDIKCACGMNYSAQQGKKGHFEVHFEF